MGKDFQAGWNFDEHTGIKERLYLNCYTPVNIDKWFDRIQLKSEMGILLLKIYHKIGGLEEIFELGNCQLPNWKRRYWYAGYKK